MVLYKSPKINLKTDCKLELEILCPARYTVPVLRITLCRASRLNFLGFFVTLSFLEVIRRSPQEFHAQRFIITIPLFSFQCASPPISQLAFAAQEGSNKKPRYLQDSPLLRQDNCSARTLLSSSYPHSVTLAARRSLLFGFVTRDSIHQPCGFCQPLSLKSFNLFFASLFSVAVVAGSLARRQFVVYHNRAPFVKGFRKLF